jgi:hypothetical protein
MLGTWKLAFSLQIGLVAVPVALYFLILGLLNSQRRPQILSARLDFALLLAALAPMGLVPLLNWVGVNFFTVAGALATVVCAVLALAPRRQQGWVIYNIDRAQAQRCLEQALDASEMAFQRREKSFELEAGAVLELSHFSLLRNVTIHVSSPGKLDPNRLRLLESELARRLGHLEVEASPMAVSFVLVSTAMIVAPLIFLADRVPEMVRLLTDLIG